MRILIVTAGSRGDVVRAVVQSGWAELGPVGDDIMSLITQLTGKS